MKNKVKVLVGVVFFNEADKIDFLLERFKKFNLPYPYKVLFINDASTDGSDTIVKKFIKRNKIKNSTILSNNKNHGVGFGIRKIINYGLKNKFSICVIMAGNGKDTPMEIPSLVTPIIEKDYDYIQGSRFLRGGSFHNLPLLRKFMILTFTSFMSLITGFRLTDSTNGFRAYKLSIFNDERIDISQPWLDRYELETYLHIKVIELKYKIKEVAVSKNYLPSVNNYSKMRPFIDWWKLSRPVFLLKLGFRR